MARVPTALDRAESASRASRRPANRPTSAATAIRTARPARFSSPELADRQASQGQQPQPQRGRLRQGVERMLGELADAARAAACRSRPR